MDPMTIIPWLAIVVLNAGYWAQIYKINEHREVRDLSTTSYVLFGLAYIILAYESHLIESSVFLVKNILTTVSVGVIIGLIIYHRDDEWHDDEDKICNCGNELETHWKFCADCGEKIENGPEAEA